MSDDSSQPSSDPVSAIMNADNPEMARLGVWVAVAGTVLGLTYRVLQDSRAAELPSADPQIDDGQEIPIEED
jgi:hypothetical protein